MARRRLELLAWVLLAGLWVQLLASLPATQRVQLSDFAGYYGAAATVLEGEPGRLYLSERKWFTNLPVVALLLAPLASLEYAKAWRLFWWLQALCFAATFAVVLWGASRHLAPLTPGAALLSGALFVSFGPVLRRCLELGQTTPMILLLLAFVWLAARAERPRLAGLLLGIACLVKIPPLLWVGLFALRRRLALAGTALAVVAAGVLASWLIFGGELVGQYAERVIWSNAGASHAAFNNRSLDGAFTRLLTDRSLLDWDPAPRPLPVTLAVAASGLGLAALLAARGGGRLLWPPAAPRDDDPRTGSLELELALGAVAMVLAFPIVWIHYYLLLALPLALLPFWWRARSLPGSPGTIALLLLGAWLASGTDVPGNVEVGERRDEPGFRESQDLQPLGALLLAVGLSTPVAVLARRERESEGDPRRI
jgi:hypothetical protein